jgi:hypothetical protein
LKLRRHFDPGCFFMIVSGADNINCNICRFTTRRPTQIPFKNNNATIRNNDFGLLCFVLFC